MDSRLPPQAEDELQRIKKLQEQQARALEPLIDMIAESLAQNDDLAAALIPWMETPEGMEAFRGVWPRIAQAYLRALDRMTR